MELDVEARFACARVLNTASAFVLENALLLADEKVLRGGSDPSGPRRGECEELAAEGAEFAVKLLKVAKLLKQVPPEVVVRRGCELDERVRKALAEALLSLRLCWEDLEILEYVGPGCERVMWVDAWVLHYLEEEIKDCVGLLKRLGEPVAEWYREENFRKGFPADSLMYVGRATEEGVDCAGQKYEGLQRVWGGAVTKRTAEDVERILGARNRLRPDGVPGVPEVKVCG